MILQAIADAPRGGLPTLNQLLRETTPHVAFGLGVVGDLLWLVVYVTAIRIAIRDKTYAIPVAAIVLNVTWELTYTLIHPPPHAVDLGASLLWLALDLVILIELLRHGTAEVQRNAGLFRLSVLGGVAAALLGHVTLYAHVTANAIFPDTGGVTVAYVINLVMSLLFLGMYFRPSDRAALSRTIAWAKMLGTALVSVANVLSIRALPAITYDVQIRAADSATWTDAGTIGSHTIHPAFFYFLFAATFAADLAYVGLVQRWFGPPPRGRPSAA